MKIDSPRALYFFLPKKSGERPSRFTRLIVTLGLLFFLPEALAKEPKEETGSMVLIPAGPFWMGLDEVPPDTETPWGQEDAKPKHQVTLPPFYIDIYEVTYGDYQKFDRNFKIAGRGAAFPVTDVTWFDADNYCRSKGKRLPTEAEWEKAARGTDGRVYPWGNEFDPDKANLGAAPTRVGDNWGDRSPYGIFDMAGNVSEWTDSWYQPYPGNTYKSSDYGIFQKVVRGGSFNAERHFAEDMFAQATFRNFSRPDVIGPDNGFRCAKPAGPPDAGASPPASKAPVGKDHPR